MYKKQTVKSSLVIDLDVGTPLYACCDGLLTHEVWKGNSNTGIGRYIQIHFKRNNVNYIARYCNVSGCVCMNPETVKAGQLIGYSGDTGHRKRPQLAFQLMKFDTEKFKPISYTDIQFTQGPLFYYHSNETIEIENIVCSSLLVNYSVNNGGRYKTVLTLS